MNHCSLWKVRPTNAHRAGNRTNVQHLTVPTPNWLIFEKTGQMQMEKAAQRVPKVTF